ncbi:MAG: DNA repair exonuclease [Clostridiales bacterium]|nr:DNA repair exonuclease [Clostridiales bacterium]
MKFIHLGDVHLGMKPDATYPWSEERHKEIWNGFRDINNICNRQEVDLLLIAGDFFHKQPLVRELKEVNYVFSKLKNTKVVIIAGNHDYISPRSNYLNFPWHSHVHMLIKDNIDSIYFDDINTEVYGFSYHQREIKDPILHDIKLRDRDRINILLAHGGTPTNLPFDIRVLESKGFDYIALGHIHKPQKLSSRIAYAGSIEPTDKNDIGKRGYIIGEINKGSSDVESDITFDFVSHSKREYINVEIEIDDSTTNGELVDITREALSKYSDKNIFIITLCGYKDPEIKFDLDNLSGLANVIDIKDTTIANYDFDQLYRQNEDNIIGSFISSINEEDEDNNIKTKALYYGIEALLYGKQ